MYVVYIPCYIRYGSLFVRSTNYLLANLGSECRDDKPHSSFQMDHGCGVTIVQEDDFPAQLLLINSGVLNDPAQWTSPANAK